METSGRGGGAGKTYIYEKKKFKIVSDCPIVRFSNGAQNGIQKCLKRLKTSLVFKLHPNFSFPVFKLLQENWTKKAKTE